MFPSLKDLRNFRALCACLQALKVDYQSKREGRRLKLGVAIEHPLLPIRHTTHGGDMPHVMFISLVPGSERFFIYYFRSENCGTAFSLRDAVKMAIDFVESSP